MRSDSTPSLVYGLTSAVAVVTIESMGVTSPCDKHWGEKAGMEAWGGDLLTPALVTCSTNAGVRRPGYKARQCPLPLWNADVTNQIYSLQMTP